jgi:hypothetical protein
MATGRTFQTGTVTVAYKPPTKKRAFMNQLLSNQVLGSEPEHHENATGYLCTLSLITTTMQRLFFRYICVGIEIVMATM